MSMSPTIPGLSERNRTAGRVVAVVIALAFVTGATASNWRYFSTGFNDFLPLYIGAKFAGLPASYDPPKVVEQQKRFTGLSNQALQWTRFPWVAVMLRPLAGLPYPWAWTLWVILSISAYLAAIRLLPNRLDALAAGYLPMWFSLMQGQDLALITLWVVLAARLQAGGSQFVAGLIFALCSQKPHLFLLLPILILRQRMWRFAQGLLAGGAALWLVSSAAGGWNWIRDWYRLVSTAPIDSGAHYMPNLAGVAINHPWLGRGGYWVLVGITLLAAWGAAGKLTGFLPGLMPVILGSLLVSRHCYFHDCAVLLPSLLALRQEHARTPSQVLLWPFVFLVAWVVPPTWVVAPMALLGVLLALACRARQSSQPSGAPAPAITEAPARSYAG